MRSGPAGQSDLVPAWHPRADAYRLLPLRLSPASGVETLFSTTKRKLSTQAPGRSPLTQQHQALLLGVTFDLLYHLHFLSFLPLYFEDVNKAR